MTKEIIIKTEKISKGYGFAHNYLEVLKEVSLEIKKGEIISIVGPSGAGKSTLLNILGCLDSFQSGSLLLLGKKIRHTSIEDLSSFRNKHLGFIFQQHNLLAEFTAWENIMLPLLIRREKVKRAKEKSFHLLKEFGLEDRKNHKPTELSGGECQRISVARAIIGEPDIILADEPTGSLDSVNSDNLINILLKLSKEKNITLIIVTHDQSIAFKTEKVITLFDGQIKDIVTN